MPTVVISKPDPASMLIGKYLTENYFEPSDKEFCGYRVHTYKNADLIVIDTLHIHAQWLDERYPSDMYIFASKHSAESGIPCLTVHATGNWGDAILGGNARSLSPAPALHMYAALRLLTQRKEEENLEKYRVSYEVTHHGPTLNTPLMFVEVGSTETEWMDEKAAEVVGDAIIAALEPKDTNAVAIGIGGGHYAPRFTDVAVKRGVAFGHMAPRYALDTLDDSMFRLAIERTVPRPSYCITHGLSAEWMNKIEKWAKRFGVKVGVPK